MIWSQLNLFLSREKETQDRIHPHKSNLLGQENRDNEREEVTLFCCVVKNREEKHVTAWLLPWLSFSLFVDSCSNFISTMSAQKSLSPQLFKDQAFFVTWDGVERKCWVILEVIKGEQREEQRGEWVSVNSFGILRWGNWSLKAMSRLEPRVNTDHYSFRQEWKKKRRILEREGY